MSVPRIEIVVIRDPDSETDITVYVDGKRVDVDEYHIDPGAGYTSAEWQDNADEIEESDASPGVKEQLLQAYADYADSEYID